MIFPVFLLFAIPVALLIGSVILRAAIKFANSRLGPAPIDIHASPDGDDWADYPIPAEQTKPTSQIPLPSIGGGMVMMLCIVIVNAIAGAAIQLVIGDEPAPRRGRFRGPLEDATFLARVLTLPVAFIIMSGLLAAMLPTTFRRGCLVAFFYFAICVGIAAVFIVPMWLLG